jgi:hypothetical protein
MVKLANLFKYVTGPAELFIDSQPIVFSLIIFYQGVFAGNAIVIPERLQNLFDNKLFRFISLMLIGFSATRDIEYAFFSTLLFILIIYILKTPKERKETGFI